MKRHSAMKQPQQERMSGENGKSKRVAFAGLQLLSASFSELPKDEDGTVAKHESLGAQSPKKQVMRRQKTTCVLGAAAAIEMVVIQMQKSEKSLETIFHEYKNTSTPASGGFLTNDEFAQLLSDNMNLKNKQAVQDIVSLASQNGTRRLSFDIVFKELIVEFLASRLQQQEKSLREVFSELDPYCYGFASASAIRAMLLEHGIQSQDADSFISIVDLKSDGRVRYTDLFETLWNDSLLENLAERHRDQERTLKAVVIITRHGARFPLKSFPNSSHWPKSKVFWEGTHFTDSDSKTSNDFAGRLTPVGCEQLMALGKTCRKKWIDNEHLLDVNHPRAPSFISAYTSNSDRTLKSAQSFFLGLFPEMPPRFMVDADEGKKEDKKKSGRAILEIVKDEGLDGIPIVVESEEYTNLLHGFKCSERYDILRAQAFKFDKENGELGKWAKDPKYSALVDKLWDMTGFKKINPKKNSTADCLSAMQSIAQSIGIERSHSMPLLRSSSGLVLTPEDEEIIREVAGHVCRLRYCGNDSQMQREMARHAAGMLPSEVVKFFTSIRDAEDDNRCDDSGGDDDGHVTPDRLRLYSAHDNTLMAMLAHLGFKDFDVPEFAAFLAFELHKRQDGSWYVRFVYNPNPRECTFEDMDEEIEHKKALPYIKLPGHRACENEAPVVSILSAEEGEMLLDKFVEIVMVERNSFADQEQWDVENPYGLKKALHDLEGLKDKEELLQQMLEQMRQRKSLLGQRIESMQVSKDIRKISKDMDFYMTEISNDISKDIQHIESMETEISKESALLEKQDS